MRTSLGPNAFGAVCRRTDALYCSGLPISWVRRREIPSRFPLALLENRCYNISEREQRGKEASLVPPSFGGAWPPAPAVQKKEWNEVTCVSGVLDNYERCIRTREGVEKI